MSFSEARARATQEALSLLGEFYAGPAEAVLDEDFLKADHCWMFFRNRSITLPKSSLLDLAFVYGKRGGSRNVPDLRENPNELATYVQRLSKFFEINRVQN
jgi:hypothetical protein